MFLHRFKDIVERVVSPLCKAQQNGDIACGTSDFLARDKLVTSANGLLQFVAKCVYDSWEEDSLPSEEMVILSKSELFSRHLRTYVKCACDCLVVDALALPNIANTNQQMTSLSASQQYLQIVETVFSDTFSDKAGFTFGHRTWLFIQATTSHISNICRAQAYLASFLEGFSEPKKPFEMLQFPATYLKKYFQGTVNIFIDGLGNL